MVNKNDYQPNYIVEKRRVYRILHTEDTGYRQLIFALRKGELQYFTFVKEDGNE